MISTMIAASTKYDTMTNKPKAVRYWVLGTCSGATNKGRAEALTKGLHVALPLWQTPLVEQQL